MGQKKEFERVRYGTKEGELKFGHVHNDEVTSGFMARTGTDHRHYMTMDINGKRKGWTTNVCPGTFQIKCGHDIKNGKPALYIEAVSGDIIFNASNGRIRMQAQNIDILANNTAGTNKSGVLTLEANEKVDIRSKNIELNGSSVVKFFSSGSCEIVAKSSLNFFGGIVAAADNACAGKKSLWGTDIEKQNA
jgi:hypothetical protein